MIATDPAPARSVSVALFVWAIDLESPPQKEFGDFSWLWFNRVIPAKLGARPLFLLAPTRVVPIQAMCERSGQS